MTGYFFTLIFILGTVFAVSGQAPGSSGPSETRRQKKPLKIVAISCGICTETAISLPKPEYPKAASYVNAGGPVNVQVLIDKLGNVRRAKVLSGHPLLRAASVKAAFKAKFTPTQISGKPINVYTTIVYNFVTQS
jgi:TonB family protein